MLIGNLPKPEPTWIIKNKNTWWKHILIGNLICDTFATCKTNNKLLFNQLVIKGLAHQWLIVDKIWNLSSEVHLTLTEWKPIPHIYRITTVGQNHCRQELGSSRTRKVGKSLKKRKKTTFFSSTRRINTGRETVVVCCDGVKTWDREWGRVSTRHDGWWPKEFQNGFLPVQSPGVVLSLTQSGTEWDSFWTRSDTRTTRVWSVTQHNLYILIWRSSIPGPSGSS